MRTVSKCPCCNGDLIIEPLQYYVKKFALRCARCNESLEYDDDEKSLVENFAKKQEAIGALSFLKKRILSDPYLTTILMPAVSVVEKYINKEEQE